MKFNCADEFDLNLIYQKLTSSSAHTVKASEFFNKQDDLSILQRKMNALFMPKKARKKTIRK